MIKKSETHKTMINTRELSASQMNVVNAIIAHYDEIAKTNEALDDATKARYAKRLYRRCEIKSANIALFNKKASAYFIAKNEAAKSKKHANLYDLTQLREVKAKAAKAEKSEKREAKANTKREKKAKRETEHVEVNAEHVSEAEEALA